MKHWTEPNGIFIVNIPIEWQYRNTVVQNGIDKSPYSFEPYEDPIGCFQLSCYPLSQKGVNPTFPIQKNNSEIEWLASRMDDAKFNMLLFHAQVDDQLCMAKYIYSAENRSDKRIQEQLQKVNSVLKTFRVIPQSDRALASNLNKFDNFQGSLGASYDLRNKALESESYIELIVILSNQIDAFLRLSIILQQQLLLKTNNIDIKYLFQGDDEKGINERIVYSKALELEILNEEIFTELNNLYDQRNRVIHRYIISFLKTREIARIAYDYVIINERIRLILKNFEEAQFGKGFGIYGRGFNKDYEFNDNDYRMAYAMVNDKHLLEKLKRKI